jgi:hypothetical protein
VARERHRGGQRGTAARLGSLDGARAQTLAVQVPQRRKRLPSSAFASPRQRKCTATLLVGHLAAGDQGNAMRPVKCARRLGGDDRPRRRRVGPDERGPDRGHRPQGAAGPAGPPAHRARLAPPAHRGRPGVTGPQGAVGATGAQGETGATGAQARSARPGRPGRRVRPALQGRPGRLAPVCTVSGPFTLTEGRYLQT